MAHSYTKILIHYVFSTKNREKIMTAPLQERLWAYMGGIANGNNMKTLAIGGIEDHVHLLISLPVTLSISKAIQLIKGGSSKWVHDTFPDHNEFKWQEGYGAFNFFPAINCRSGLACSYGTDILDTAFCLKLKNFISISKF